MRQLLHLCTVTVAGAEGATVARDPAAAGDNRVEDSLALHEPPGQMECDSDDSALSFLPAAAFVPRRSAEAPGSDGSDAELENRLEGSRASATVSTGELCAAAGKGVGTMSDGCIKGLNVPPTLLSSILHGKTKVVTDFAREHTAWPTLDDHELKVCLCCTESEQPVHHLLHNDCSLVIECRWRWLY